MNISALNKLATVAEKVDSEKRAADGDRYGFGGVDWKAVKQKIDDAWKWYKTTATGSERALIGGGLGLLGGAALGKLMGRTGLGAVGGALAGAGAGYGINDIRNWLDNYKRQKSNESKSEGADPSTAHARARTMTAPASQV